MHSIFLAQNKVLGRKTFQPDSGTTLIPLETSMKNPAVADRAFVGLGHVYIAKALKSHAGSPPFLGQRSALAPIWQL